MPLDDALHGLIDVESLTAWLDEHVPSIGGGRPRFFRKRPASSSLRWSDTTSRKLSEWRVGRA